MTRKLKVLLLAPYITGMLEGFEELGICYIAAVLRKGGNEVLLLESHVDAVDYQKITEFGPDIIGMPVYEMTKKAVYQLCEKFHQLLPSAYLCVGGIQPTYSGELMMEELPILDFAIRGEGEPVFAELVSSLEENKELKSIGGLIYREGQQVISNIAQQYIGNLDSLPYPARDILVANKYNMAQMSTSRGCTGRCSFCSSQLFWKKWRGRSPQNVVDEIEEISRKHQIEIFNFIDSSFEDPGIKYGRIGEIAREILNRGLFITYNVDVQADFHREATPELMKLLKESGLISVMIGLETNNEADLKLYNKKQSLADNLATIKLFASYGIVVKCGFINFNPYSTFEGLAKNIDFLEEHGFALNYENTALRYMMYKGTQLYNKLKEDGLLTGDEYAEKGYKYLDPRIEMLADYVYYYMRQHEPTRDAFLRIRYFNPYYLILLAGCRRQFTEERHPRAFKALNNFEQNQGQKVIELTSEINARVSAWFRELMQLAESGWDGLAAEKISNQYLNSGYMQEMADQLDRLKNNLYLNLTRQGYSSFLVKMC